MTLEQEIQDALLEARLILAVKTEKEEVDRKNREIEQRKSDDSQVETLIKELPSFIKRIAQNGCLNQYFYRSYNGRTYVFNSIVERLTDLNIKFDLINHGTTRDIILRIEEQ